MNFWLPKASIMSYAFAMVALWSTIARFCLYSSESSGVYIYALFIIISIYGLCKEEFLDFRYISFSIILFVVFNVTYAISYFVNGAPVSNTEYLTLYYMILIVSSKDIIKNDSFDIFIKIWGLLLGLGLIEYFSFILFQKYIDLGVVDRELIITQSFYHGAFCLFRVGLDVFRFQGLAEEPGLVGTLCGFLIYLVSGIKKYKYHNVIFWLSGFFSFSFAFYILAAIYLFQNKKNIKYLIGVILFSCILYSSFKEYFDFFLFDRLEREDHGNNRSDEALDIAFEKSIKDGSIWFGHGKDSHQLLYLNSGVAGAKVWLYQYGVVCFIIIFLGYEFYGQRMAKHLRLKRGKILLFSFVFWISFFQRQYIEMPYNVLIFFAAPCMLCNYSKNRKYSGVVKVKNNIGYLSMPKSNSKYSMNH